MKKTRQVTGEYSLKKGLFSPTERQIWFYLLVHITKCGWLFSKSAHVDNFLSMFLPFNHAFYRILRISTTPSPQASHRSFLISPTHFLFCDKNLLINSLYFACKIQIYMLGLRKLGDNLYLGSFPDSLLFLVLLPLLLIVPGLLSFLTCPLPLTIMFCSHISVFVFVTEGKRGRCMDHTLLFPFYGSVQVFLLKDPWAQELRLSCIPLYMQCLPKYAHYVFIELIIANIL